ncbi:hypothetical protein BDV93DRAFT_507040 [Ceratobasidium sp. AG-I]|nr:hypothetical protein BDV93DRAFT_507040 [Ceratobasidium sp. AG-I]
MNDHQSPRDLANSKLDHDDVIAIIAAIAITAAPSIAAITFATDAAQRWSTANEEEEEQDDDGDNDEINTTKDNTSSNMAPATKISSAATTSGTAKKAASSSRAASSSKAVALSKNSVPAAPVAPAAVLTSGKWPLEDKGEEPEPEPSLKRLWPRMKGVPKEDDMPGEAQVRSVRTKTLVEGPDGLKGHSKEFYLFQNRSRAYLSVSTYNFKGFDPVNRKWATPLNFAYNRFTVDTRLCDLCSLTSFRLVHLSTVDEENMQTSCRWRELELWKAKHFEEIVLQWEHIFAELRDLRDGKCRLRSLTS